MAGLGCMLEGEGLLSLCGSDLNLSLAYKFQNTRVVQLKIDESTTSVNLHVL